MRVFAALPLPPSAVDSIVALIGPIRRTNPGLRWVSASTYHLTLHFFGEVEGESLSALRRIFEDSRLTRPAFVTRLNALGQFPPRGNPRVLWVSLADDGGRIRAFWEDLESALAPLGWKPDARGFTPHITLARNNDSRVASGWDSSVQMPGASFSLSECVLFQSLLGRGGAEYVPLARLLLDGDPG